MTLETVYYIGQTVAVVVITATLIAILVQTRQTNALARAETSRTLLFTLITEQHRLFGTPEDSDFMIKALRSNESMTDGEKQRFAFSMALIFGMAEVGFNMQRSGLFPDIDQARATDTIRMAYLSSPRVQKWWSNSRHYYAANQEFVAMIDALAAEASTPP